MTNGYSISDAEANLARAEQLASEAVERDPNSSLAHYTMGSLRRLQKNRLREAQIEFEKALALDPNNYVALRQIGWTFSNLGEPEACLAGAERQLRLSPKDPTVWENHSQLGVCHLQLNHADLAVENLIKARTENPRVPWWLHYWLAGALGLKGDLVAGRAELAEAVKQKPEITSIEQYYLRKGWYSSPEGSAVEDRTLNEGLRRLGFPEK